MQQILMASYSSSTTTKGKAASSYETSVINYQPNPR